MRLILWGRKARARAQLPRPLPPGQPAWRDIGHADAVQLGGSRERLITPSFRGDAQHRTRNLEVARRAIAHLRFASRPGTTQGRGCINVRVPQRRCSLMRAIRRDFAAGTVLCLARFSFTTGEYAQQHRRGCHETGPSWVDLPLGALDWATSPIHGDPPVHILEPRSPFPELSPNSVAPQSLIFLVP
jgi:hypothetical protein